MDRKETVQRAVHFDFPARIPLLYACSLEKTDVLNVPVVDHFTGPGGRFSEWGFEWERLDEGLLMGQPKAPVLPDWNDLRAWQPPKANAPDRFARFHEQRRRYGPDRYYKANFSLSGFAVVSMLRGFSQTMEDFYLAPEELAGLCDRVFGFEEAVIELAAKEGFDAIGLADDWGTQTSLFISPQMWRELFCPRYERQIALAHSLGMDVYLHSCGYIYDIIGDLQKIGLDILNPGQCNINNVARMGEAFRSQLSFACSPSYQSTAISGSREDIERQIGEYAQHLADKRGGLIGILPEDSAGLGVTPEKIALMEQAFAAVRYS